MSVDVLLPGQEGINEHSSDDAEETKMAGSRSAQNVFAK